MTTTEIIKRAMEINQAQFINWAYSLGLDGASVHSMDDDDCLISMRNSDLGDIRITMDKGLVSVVKRVRCGGRIADTDYFSGKLVWQSCDH